MSKANNQADGGPDGLGNLRRLAYFAAVVETGATSVKEMGKVMAALRAKHAAVLDMAKAGPMVKAALGAG